MVYLYADDTIRVNSPPPLDKMAAVLQTIFSGAFS